jgi:hypothetical protein
MYLALAACFALPGCVIPDDTTNPMVDSGSVGKLVWVLTGDGTITFAGEGAMPDYKESATWYLRYYEDYIKKAVIENGVTNIGGGAFDGCITLADVTIPESVTSIGRYAFRGCPELVNFEVDADNSKFIAENSVLFNKDKTTLVAYPAASGAYTIPDGVARIGEGAFGGCADLTGITVGDAVTSVGYGAFNGCTRLVNFEVGAGNANLSSGNGVLFDKDKTKLIAYPAAKGGYIIPVGVTSIGGGAFEDCTGLTSLTMGNDVTSIGGGAFAGCTGLVTLVIGSGVTSIGYGVFSGCTGLKNVRIMNTTPPTLDTSNFTAAGDTLSVPAGCKEAYEKTAWKDAFSNIVES